ncbi:MAG: Dam family site-specific DNA-(adenine-N6)-methyltransferase [Alphaproteobacteria bacterium]|nr:Dam family site-specific DNA-(adenine-N6)-methyltransferase [Alphaproteobacteria bacterium]
MVKDKNNLGIDLMKPFLKWAGGKYKSIDKIKSVLPSGHRLVEPFCGSCAVSLNLDYENYLLADFNQDLINLYKILVAENQHFINYAKSFFTEENRTSEKYYELRYLFNTTNNIRLKSALFVYLNRHGFNGLCRYNSKGLYNVPIGSYKTIYFPELEMKNFADKLKNAKFVCQSFEKTLQQANKRDIVYCDPPYMPLNTKSSFTSYTEYGFELDAQKYLAQLADDYYDKGYKIFISNHDTELTQSLYKKSSIKSFDVRRMISANGTNRGFAPELIACYN